MIYNDNDIINWVNNTPHHKINWKKLPKDIEIYLLNRYNDSDSLKESCARIIYNIEEHPKCKHCGKKLKFGERLDRYPFGIYCSYECRSQDKNWLDKQRKTKEIHFGDPNYNNREKYKNTCLKRYGCENPYQSNEVKEKIMDTKNKLHGDPYYNNPEKVHKTNLERYGFEMPFQSKNILEKCKQTLIKRYNVDNPMFNDELKQKMLDTKYKKYGCINVTGNKFNSKSEKIIYNILKTKFKDIYHNYRNELYPYNCDFYIKDIDTYIEYQGFVTHGDHPFDETNINDIEELEFLKYLVEEKHSKNIYGSLYESIITCWTISDPLKRKTAKDNNLKFLEFWNIDEIKLWINTL